MEAVQFVELLGCEVPLLVELKRLVDPRLQVEAVLHPPPVLHLQAARTMMLQIIKHSTSVADPGCLFRVPDLGSWIQQEQKRGGEIFFCSHKFHKNSKLFYF